MFLVLYILILDVGGWGFQQQSIHTQFNKMSFNRKIRRRSNRQNIPRKCGVIAVTAHHGTVHGAKNKR